MDGRDFALEYEAENAAAKAGHELGAWEVDDVETPGSMLAECVICGRFAWVDPSDPEGYGGSATRAMREGTPVWWMHVRNRAERSG